LNASTGNETIQFSELIVLLTTPLFWEPRSPFYADKLQEFLLFLVAENKPGYGALLDRSTSSWHSGDDAVPWLQDAYREVWLPGAESLEASGYDQVESSRVFNHYTDHEAVVFLDKERLEACISAVDGPEDMYLNVDVPDDIYLSFYLTWYDTAKGVVWAPQLRICNYWPHDSSLAPDRPAGVSSALPLDAEDAADVLRNKFYSRVDDQFRLLRYAFHLAEAQVTLRSQKFMPPVFYYARPTLMPDEHKNFLYAPHLPALQTLATELIETHDPFGADVTGAFMEGSVVGFRRDMVISRAVQAWYLFLPWMPKPEEDREAEVERETSFIADKFSYFEFSAGITVGDIVTGLSVPSTAMALWAGTLESALSMIQDFQPLVAFESRTKKRKEWFRLVGYLHSSLSRLEAGLLSQTDEVLRLARRWEGEKEGPIAFTRSLLTTSPLEHVAPLLDGLDRIPLYQLYEQQVRRAAQRARQLREQFNNATSALQSMLDQQRREEQERQEGITRLLGAGLAVLAAVTAFPLFIGQMDWEALQDEIRQWAGWSIPFRWVGQLFQILHPLLVFIATVSALVLIVLLLFLVVGAFLRLDRRRRDSLSDIGGKVGELAQLVKDASQLRLELAEVDASKPEPDEDKELRRAIEELDKEACQRLVEAWNWLKGKNRKVLSEDTEWFVISTALLDNRPRPVPFPLPRALFLYQYKYDSVSDYELARSLRSYGFDIENVEKVKGLVKQLQGLEPQQFESGLRDAGVSALQDKPIELPSGHPT
jgi:hypothetical protein